MASTVLRSPLSANLACGSDTKLDRRIKCLAALGKARLWCDLMAMNEVIPYGVPVMMWLGTSGGEMVAAL